MNPMQLLNAFGEMSAKFEDLSEKYSAQDYVNGVAGFLLEAVLMRAIELGPPPEYFPALPDEKRKEMYDYTLTIAMRRK